MRRVYGIPWGQTRRYSNRLSVSRDPGNGYNWFIDQLPYLERGSVNNKSHVFVMGGAGRPVAFAETSVSYSPTFGGTESLQVSSSRDRFSYTGVDGSVTEFDSITGLFKRYVAPGGQVIQVTQLTATRTKIAQIQQSCTINGVTTLDQYTYAFTQPFDQRLASVTLSRSVNGGATQNIQRAVYTYYGLHDANGTQGDLQTATTQTWLNSTWVTTDTFYYRYWKNPASGSSSSSGSSTSSASSSSSTAYQAAHLLKYALNPASYARMVADGFTPETSSDAQLALYADYYFEYDNQRRVTKETIRSGS
jgi:hypothetical protein